MSIDKAVTAIAEAISNLANAGNNISASINRYCDLTEAQDRIMFEGFSKQGAVTNRLKTDAEHLSNKAQTVQDKLSETVPNINEADPIGAAIKADRTAAAEAKKAAAAAEAAETDAEADAEADAVRAKAKADADAMIAEAKATVEAAKAAKAAKAAEAEAEAEAEADQDVAPSTPSEKEAEPSEYDVEFVNDAKTASYDDTRKVLIDAVKALGKAPVAAILADKFDVTNIKGLNETQNAQLIAILEVEVAAADIPF